jgi:hypothetical protein
MVETASYFVSISYAPWLLKSYLSQKVLVNNLAAFKTIFEILVSLLSMVSPFAFDTGASSVFNSI